MVYKNKYFVFSVLMACGSEFYAKVFSIPIIETVLRNRIRNRPSADGVVLQLLPIVKVAIIRDNRIAECQAEGVDLSLAAKA